MVSGLLPLVAVLVALHCLPWPLPQPALASIEFTKLTRLDDGTAESNALGKVLCRANSGADLANQTNYFIVDWGRLGTARYKSWGTGAGLTYLFENVPLTESTCVKSMASPILCGQDPPYYPQAAISCSLNQIIGPKPIMCSATVTTTTTIVVTRVAPATCPSS